MYKVNSTDCTMSEALLVPSVLVLATLWLITVRLRQVRPRLPPGPQPWPLIGNVLDMPTIQPWKKYREWCKTYNLPMHPTLIVGTIEAATDLFEKKSHIYSDRLQSVMANLLGWDFAFSLMPYSSRWRFHRRVFHQEFQQSTVDRYHPIQLEHTKAFLSWTLKSPEHTRKHVRQHITSIIFFTVYGKKITSMNDEYVIAAQMAVEGIGLAVVPGAYWVEFLPILRYVPSWVPGTGWKRDVAKYRTYVSRMINKPFQEVKTSMQNGTASRSLAAILIERNEQGRSNEEVDFDEIAKNVTGVAYAGAADTTTAACESFLLAMALFPHVQEKAHTELDSVVGLHRLPEFTDLENMPYVRAVIMESMRWMPVGPFGIPHVLSADDAYNGYHIPKGTAVVPNIWAMLRDPKDYPEPDQFKPERFIGNDGKIDYSVRDPFTIAFGFGRRICPGRFYGIDTVSIFVASVLHAFDISPGVDEHGKPIVLSTEMIGAMIAMPEEVPCGLKPRSETVAGLIREYAVDLAAL